MFRSSLARRTIDGIVRCSTRLRCLSGSAAKLQVDANIPQTRIKKLLIANRGEIACRIQSTCRRLGIKTVAVFSDADRHAMHVSLADEAYHIGPSPAIESYLVKEKLIKVALQSSSNAIHPGYGFLSENYEFATLCSSEGIKFVGPSADSIKNMGIKSLSKSIMIKAGVPVIPGFHNDSMQENKALFEEACKIGFPVMIKAVRGGGGKGMRIANSEAEFIAQLDSARREAMKSFGDDVVLLEKFISRPRHIEVQVFGDQHGNCVHLFERDCSSQRRHQKVIEEAPAPHISAQDRHDLGMAAVQAAQAVKYEGAGTVEFIYDTAEKKFYFMEMNTRLQVEHPVTEMITGLDLVEWQLRVASGEPLPRSQSDFLHPRGHAFEARIYAEDAESNFMPCTGLIESIALPTSTGPEDVRLETGVRAGDQVSVFYDPMIAKLVVWAPDRRSALLKLRRSLNEYRIVGLKTNVDYLSRLASHEKFESGEVYTDFIADYSQELQKPVCTDQRQRNLFKAVAALSLLQREKAQQRTGHLTESNDIHTPFTRADMHFLSGSRPQRLLQLRFSASDPADAKDSAVNIFLKGSSHYEMTIGDETFHLSLDAYNATTGKLEVTSDGVKSTFTVFTHGERSTSIFTSEFGVITFELEIPKFIESSDGSQPEQSSFDGRSVRSPMPALVERMVLSVGDKVRNGDTLVILTAMKMEHVIKATFDSPDQERTVEQVLCVQGDSVAKGAKLVKFTEI